MKSSLLALIALITPLAASAAVNIEWKNPEGYRDAYSSSIKSEKSRQLVLDELQKFIVQQASARLKEGQTLKIVVTDVDLAGEYEPWTEQRDVRVVRGSYFARISFDYELSDESGKILKSGSEKLVNNLMIAPSMPDRNEIAPYLRDSLRSWVRNTI